MNIYDSFISILHFNQQFAINDPVKMKLSLLKIKKKKHESSKP